VVAGTGNLQGTAAGVFVGGGAVDGTADFRLKASPTPAGVLTGSSTGGPMGAQALIGTAVVVADPVVSIASGTFPASQAITVTCATVGATIHYTATTNGTTPADPTNASPVWVNGILDDYANAGQQLRIKFIAYKA
jgi:hypothetical protein